VSAQASRWPRSNIRRIIDGHGPLRQRDAGAFEVTLGGTRGLLGLIGLPEIVLESSARKPGSFSPIESPPADGFERTGPAPRESCRSRIGFADDAVARVVVHRLRGVYGYEIEHMAARGRGIVTERPC